MADSVTRLSKLAYAACEKFPNSVNKAVGQALRVLNADRKLLAALTREIVARAVRDAVNHRRGKLRWQEKYRHCGRGLEAVAATADVALRSLLDWWQLPDGRVLGDVLGGELGEMV